MSSHCTKALREPFKDLKPLMPTSPFQRAALASGRTGQAGSRARRTADARHHPPLLPAIVKALG